MTRMHTSGRGQLYFSEQWRNDVALTGGAMPLIFLKRISKRTTVHLMAWYVAENAVVEQENKNTWSRKIQQGVQKETWVENVCTSNTQT